ncbi:MAG: helix-turn-helix domain-containing protein, partial [Dehalococcoidales bacterium]|nr:helix-turn-helix domain-containing protein [Dehalococcoidales bacterium]
AHPTRIKILHCLAEAPLGFSELKKRLDIDSSGLLQFHLGKLQGLVKVSQEGNYVLTGEGVLEFTWQFCCRNPYDYPLGMTINDVGITVLTDVENPISRMTSFLIQEEKYHYTLTVTVDPDSTAIVSGTLFFNTTSDYASKITEYMSVNGVRIDHFTIGATFSNGAPFMSLYKDISLSVSPDQEPNR